MSPMEDKFITYFQIVLHGFPTNLHCYQQCMRTPPQTLMNIVENNFNLCLPDIYIYIYMCIYIYMKVKVKLLSCVWFFEIPWTVAYQGTQSMEFSRQEYWSGLPFPFPGYIRIHLWFTYFLYENKLLLFLFCEDILQYICFSHGGVYFIVGWHYLLFQFNKLTYFKLKIIFSCSSDY